ncbi:hypothetical protein HYH02_000210 [Chlamydomonas schloesseri]|uniref:GB1/RHD3-type G domain-containing protein n=1 Tax=Chlamydomonas schloesseri TaxID=2026947 RepID=A0A835WMJ5_9CHLO|nr:hypothetical protein HYH02_000210 [Chlamydomonas schloesseri]|eukprot:KAG2450107.1 hypothetical protein HYH02_000210 [Chlamydomonas schloesseri]
MAPASDACIGAPLALVTWDPDTGKFEFGPGLEALKAATGQNVPLAVVAVTGLPRTGKSSLLNQLVRELQGSELPPQHGFKTGHTTEACTQGLDMWWPPLPVRLPAAGADRDAADGRPTHRLLLLDVEGTSAARMSKSRSVRVMALTALLSSMFIYNSMNVIDEDAVERLGLVGEVVRRVREHAGAHTGGLGKHAPTFVWVLRDAHLQPAVINGREETPTEYMERQLAPLARKGTNVADPDGGGGAGGGGGGASDDPRVALGALFPHANECRMLPQPLADGARLRAGAGPGSLAAAELAPAFREGVRELATLIGALARPKSWAGVQPAAGCPSSGVRNGDGHSGGIDGAGAASTPVTGPVLAALLEAYVGAINSGAVPVIADAWEATLRRECDRACAAAEEAYEAAWAEGPEPQDAHQLQQRHEACLGAAQMEFEAIAVGPAPLQSHFQQQWRGAVQSRYNERLAGLLGRQAEAARRQAEEAQRETAQARQEMRDAQERAAAALQQAAAAAAQAAAAQQHAAAAQQEAAEAREVAAEARQAVSQAQRQAAAANAEAGRSRQQADAERERAEAARRQAEELQRRETEARRSMAEAALRAEEAQRQCAAYERARQEEQRRAEEAARRAEAERHQAAAAQQEAAAARQRAELEAQQRDEAARRARHAEQLQQAAEAERQQAEEASLQAAAAKKGAEVERDRARGAALVTAVAAALALLLRLRT